MKKIYLSLSLLLISASLLTSLKANAGSILSDAQGGNVLYALSQEWGDGDGSYQFTALHYQAMKATATIQFVMTDYGTHSQHPGVCLVRGAHKILDRSGKTYVGVRIKGINNPADISLFGAKGVNSSNYDSYGINTDFYLELNDCLTNFEAKLREGTERPGN